MLVRREQQLSPVVTKTRKRKPLTTSPEKMAVYLLNKKIASLRTHLRLVKRHCRAVAAVLQTSHQKWLMGHKSQLVFFSVLGVIRAPDPTRLNSTAS